VPGVRPHSVGTDVSGHDGFLGVVYGKHRDERTVITLWRDLTSAQALDDSQIYKTTVAEIDATGFIIGPSTLDVLEVEELVLDQTASDPEATDSG
jgi:hypothetical protein